jgi:hypothetical protein
VFTDLISRLVRKRSTPLCTPVSSVVKNAFENIFLPQGTQRYTAIAPQLFPGSPVNSYVGAMSSLRIERFREVSSSTAFSAADQLRRGLNSSRKAREEDDATRRILDPKGPGDLAVLLHADAKPGYAEESLLTLGQIGIRVKSLLSEFEKTSNADRRAAIQRELDASGKQFDEIVGSDRFKSLSEISNQIQSSLSNGASTQSLVGNLGSQASLLGGSYLELVANGSVQRLQSLSQTLSSLTQSPQARFSFDEKEEGGNGLSSARARADDLLSQVSSGLSSLLGDGTGTSLLEIAADLERRGDRLSEDEAASHALSAKASILFFAAQSLAVHEGYQLPAVFSANPRLSFEDAKIG